MRELKVFRWIHKTIMQHDKKLYLLLFFYSVCSSLFVLAFVYIPKVILDLVEKGESLEKMILVITLFGLTIAFSKGISDCMTDYCNAHYMKIRLGIICEMGEKFMQRKYSDLETPSFMDLSQKADVAVKGCSPGIEAAIKCLTVMGGHIVTCICGLVAFVSFQPFLVVVIFVVVLLNRYLNQKRQDYEKNQMDSIVAAQRRMDYNFDLMSDFRYGKEIRLFNFSKNIMNNFCSMADTVRTAKNGILKKSIITKFLISFFAFIQLVIIYYVTTKAVNDGVINIGSYLTYIGLVSVFANAMNSLMDDVVGFKYHCMYVNDLMNFFDLMKEEKQTDAIGLKSLKDTMWKLEFRDVSFHYPNTSVQVIDHLNLVIHKGDKIAITGLNGAGKTTLIKLLTRLYEPTDGAIFMNDVDIRKIDRKEYYSLFAPMFQEVFMFAFSIAQNISLKPQEATDTQRIREVLEQVGLSKKMEELPKQLDTNCLNFLDPEGIQFSGGEQQRLILARTLYVNRDIFIFDEPTAALDPISENQVYSEFYNMTENKTAIFITHRLASTKFCNHVYVLNQGKIVEEGTHETLLEKKGEYYSLYTLQADNYRLKEVSYVE